jgi:hypothetical protein
MSCRVSSAGRRCLPDQFDRQRAVWLEVLRNERCHGHYRVSRRRNRYRTYVDGVAAAVEQVGDRSALGRRQAQT